jgi:hypothetical protein
MYSTMNRTLLLTASIPFVLALSACHDHDDTNKVPPVAASATLAQATPPAAVAVADKSAPSACRQLARKCHGHNDSELAQTCHRMGHAAKSEEECAAKTAECLAACSGGEEAHEGHAHAH